MKKKYLAFAAIPLFVLVLAGAASAHGGFGMMRNATPEEVAQHHTEMFQSQANVLGVSVDEVKNAWAQGKTLEQLAQEKGISTDQLRQKMQEQRKADMKAHLQTLVDKGVITQSQADQRLRVMETQGQNGRGMGRGMGHMHGFGM